MLRSSTVRLVTTLTNDELWIKALKQAEDELHRLNIEIDVISRSRYNGPEDEYSIAFAARKNQQRRLLDMRLASQRGEEYLVWKLSFV